MAGNGKSPIAWKYVVAIDLFLIFATLLRRHIHDMPNLGRFLAPFNLGAEMNIAVWWSGITLALAGFIAYGIFCAGSAKSRFAWLALSAVLLGLSLDEIGSIHERVGSVSLFLLGCSAVLILFAYTIVKLLGDAGTRRSGILIIAGFLCFGLTAAQEYVEHVIAWPDWLSGVRIAMEEGSELLGTLLILLGVVPHGKNDLPGNPLSPIVPLVPDPTGLKGFREVLFLGAGLSAAVSLLVFPSLSDIGRRGNPSVWYPAILYFLVSCALFREGRKTTSPRMASVDALSVLFLLSSVYCVFPIYKTFPEIAGIVPYRVLEYSGIYFLHLAGVWIYLKKFKPLSTGRRNVFAAFAALTISSLFFRDPSVKLLILTLASLCTALIFLTGPQEAEPLKHVALTAG